MLFLKRLPWASFNLSMNISYILYMTSSLQCKVCEKCGSGNEHVHQPRYLLAHIYPPTVPADNRRTLKEVSKALDNADAAYSEAAKRGKGPAAAAAAALSAVELGKKQLAVGAVGGGGGGATKGVAARGSQGNTSANPRCEQMEYE